MAAEKKETWQKVLLINDIFRLNDYVILTLPQKKLPVKFHPQIYLVNEQFLGIKLPDHWWRFFNFELGMEIRLTQLHRDGVFFTTGEIVEISYQKVPNIVIHHDNNIRRDQRRFFYRVAIDRELTIKDVKMPEGQRILNLSTMLMDLSAGGVGLTSTVFLPPGTVMKIRNLLYPMLPERRNQEHQLHVVWCTVKRPTGFRVGACFDYPHERAQDAMVSMINQVQRIRLTHHYQVRESE